MKAEDVRIALLIQKLQGGDKTAFEELYKLTSPKAYFVALKICQNEHDAEDILQESYIKVLEKIDTVDPEKNFTAWLYQIVANKSKNLIKSKKPLLFSNEENESIESMPYEELQFNPEEQINQEELRFEVMAAVDELTAEKRACIMMMYFGDMSIGEIAESLEIPVSTVKNRLFTARKDLKDKFEKKGITALYSAAPLGLVIWATNKSCETVASAFSVSSASAAVLTGVASSASNSANAATAAAATAKAVGAKAAALSVTQKVVAGVAAASVIGTGTAGIATVVKNNNLPTETTTHVEEVTTAPSQTAEYTFGVITSESTDPEEKTELSSKSETTSKAETTLKRELTATTAPELRAETTKKSPIKTTAKQTTTYKYYYLFTTTKKQTTTEIETKKQTATQKSTTTAKPDITEQTVKPTDLPPPITQPTTALPATLIVEVTDFDDNVVDTLTLSVAAGTEMTWDYLITLVSKNGYEAMAGIYGDGVDTVAKAGETYTFTAEL